jgi:hypothetical protein
VQAEWPGARAARDRLGRARLVLAADRKPAFTVMSSGPSVALVTTALK